MKPLVSVYMVVAAVLFVATIAYILFPQQPALRVAVLTAICLLCIVLAELDHRRR